MQNRQNIHRIREMSLEHSREHSRERSYIKGVVEASGEDKDDILFIDPDKLTSEDPKELLKQFLKQAKNQFPEDLGLEISVKDVITDGDAAEVFIMFAQDIKDNGPRALAGANIVIMPSSKYETKEALLTSALEKIYDKNTIERIIKNSPGSDNEWNRLIGNHEGTHLTEENDYDTDLEKLIEEKRADIGAESIAESRGDKDVSFSIRDIRHLATEADVGHATGTPLISGDTVSQIHVDAAESYRESMDNAVDSNFDWDSYEGEASDGEDLLKENPEAYFSTLNKIIDETILTIEDEIASYEGPLTYGDTNAVVTLQIELDYMKNFESAYLRRVMGQDVPEHEPIQFISQEQENDFYAEFAENNKDPDPTPIELEQIDHQKTIDTENNIPEQAFESFDWDFYEGKATTTGELLFEDSDLYFKVQINYLEKMRNKAQDQYNADPSYENTQKLIEVQTLINNRYASMDTYKEDVLGQNIPFRADVILIRAEMQKSFYEESARRNAPETTPKDKTPTTEEPFTKVGAKAAGLITNSQALLNYPEQKYKTGINESAYTTEVSNVTSGTPSVNFEEGVTVNGTPITNIFSEIANPDPNDIKIMNARITTPEEPFTFPIQEAKNDANFSTTA